MKAGAAAAARIGAVVVGCAAVLAVAACSPGSSPVAGPAPGSYRGAADGHPWDNAPNSWSNSKWTPGDRASWEAALRQRTQYQSEYDRMH